MVNRNGTAGKKSGNRKHQNQNAPSQICEKLADQGDVLGLLDYLEDDAKALTVGSSMKLISRCIRTKAKVNLCGLCDDAFARIIGMATLLLARTQLYITERLTEAEAYGAHAKSGLPCDLIDEGWIERTERISRFISEMATIRSRVQHINRLNADARQSPINSKWLDNRSPMDCPPGPPRNGKAAPANGRISCPESRIEFP